MQKRIKLAALFSAAEASLTHAGASIGEDKSISVGFGARGSFTSAKDGAPEGSARSNDFNLDSARLFFGASLNKNVKGVLNTEWDGDQMRGVRHSA